MILTDKTPWYDELTDLIGLRAIQIIILSIISLTVCQLLKVLLFSIRDKKLAVNALFTTGGMPSSHTGTVITLVISLGIFQFNDLGSLDFSFAVALIFAIVTIHDAMGVRYEASKHAKILNNLVADEELEVKRQLGFGKKGKLKELLGHKIVEVIGGLIVGTLVGIVGSFLFINFS